MAKESFWQNYVGCPFYRSDDQAHRITCEGIVDGSSITQFYRSRKDFSIQIKTFCCVHYERCELYRMLMEKYNDQ